MARIVPALVAASLAVSGAALAQNTSPTNTGTTTGLAPGSSSGAVMAPGITPGVGPGGAPGGITPGVGPTGTGPLVGSTTPSVGATSMGGGMRPSTAPMGAAPSPTFGGGIQGQANGAAPAGVAATANPSRTTAAPVAGANSFTMGQARSRLQRNGYTQVTGLHKDGQGVWRGKAMKDGQPADVSLDYQGNVVGQ